MIVYQVHCWEQEAGAMSPAPRMEAYEVFQNRDNAVAFMPGMIMHYRELYELQPEDEVHAVIEELEVMDMPNANWDPIGGRPVNPDVVKAAAFTDELSIETANDCLSVLDAYDYHRQDWEY